MLFCVIRVLKLLICVDVESVLYVFSTFLAILECCVRGATPAKVISIFLFTVKHFKISDRDLDV